MASLQRRTAEQESGIWQGVYDRASSVGPIDRVQNNFERRIEPLIKPIEWGVIATRAAVDATQWAFAQYKNFSAKPQNTNPYGRPQLPMGTSRLPNTKTVVGQYRGLYNTSSYVKGPRGQFMGRR